MAKTETQMSKDEQIGYHKGSLSVLAKEREELLKIVNITEQLMQMHLQQLEELGIKIQTQEKTENVTPKKTKKKIEELL